MLAKQFENNPLSILLPIVALVTIFAFVIFDPRWDTKPTPNSEVQAYNGDGGNIETAHKPDEAWTENTPPIESPEPELAMSPFDPPLEPDPPSEYFDDGRPDLLSGRQTAFERWTLDNAEIWDEMDRQLQDCVYMSYVNAFGSSPEAGIDWCLAQAERADAEAMDK